MYYFVLYEYYEEYNQFEGRWYNDWNKFKTLRKAKAFIKDIQTNTNYKNIILTQEVFQ